LNGTFYSLDYLEANLYTITKEKYWMSLVLEKKFYWIIRNFHTKRRWN